MKALHLIACFVLAFEMPVPIYWLILHGRIEFWRRHVRTGYWVAVLAAWGGGDWLLYHFRAQLFLTQLPALGALLAGVALIALDVFTFTTVEFELGGRRLVGHAELTRSGALTTRGLYTCVRHPRYLGMMAAVLGGCLLMGTQWLWIAGALWCLLALWTIRLEERELRLRFGPAYADYAKCVPALLPFRFRPRQG